MGKGGRPLKFKTVKELETKIEEYFQSCWGIKLDMYGNKIKDKETKEYVFVQKIPYTITGLATFLDTSRETLINYEEKDEFFDTIKRAKEKCHAYAEESLFIGKNPAGAIFNLKNNYGWKDKSETELSGGLSINQILNDIEHRSKASQQGMEDKPPLSDSGRGKPIDNLPEKSGSA